MFSPKVGSSSNVTSTCTSTSSSTSTHSRLTQGITKVLGGCRMMLLYHAVACLRLLGLDRHCWPWRIEHFKTQSAQRRALNRTPS